MTPSLLHSGVPRLDEVLGGIVVGDLPFLIGPSSGKTTLACQVGGAVAAAGQHVQLVSTLSEAAPRLTKHLRKFSFWEPQLPRSPGPREAGE